MPDTRSPDRRHLLLIPLAALFVVHPLIVHGCSCGHDFDFHLLSWMEAAAQLTHGNLHPRWAFTPAFNAGEPRFVFYPPISWYLGALLGLILTHLPGVSESAAQTWGWTATPILFTWIALTLSGLTMHRLARAYASPNAALLAALLYLANPYMLFTAFERTAYAELLAAAWIPLLLLSILPAFGNPQTITIPRIALPLALLWLTNAPAAIMGTYTLALLATLLLATEPGAPCLASETWDSRHITTPSAPTTYPSPPTTNPGAPSTNPGAPSTNPGAPSYRGLIAIRWVNRATSERTTLHLALTTLAGATLAFALAAVYLLPAAYQRRFVQVSMATIAGMRIDQNFLFEHTGPSPDNLLHDQVLHTASLIAALLLAATALALLAVRLTTTPGAPEPALSLSKGLDSQTWESRHNASFPLLPLAILTVLLAFLLTPLSAPLWTHAPEAELLQFPWRLLAILAPILCLTLARALTARPGAPFIRVSSGWVGSNPLATRPRAPSIPVSSGWVGRNTPALTLTTLIALALPAYHLFRQPCDPEDTAPARLALFHSAAGTDPTDEYTPTTADNDALTPNNPPDWLADSPTAAPTTNAGAPQPALSLPKGLDSEMWEVPPPPPGPAPTHLTLTASHPETLILNLRDYPAWRIALNGAPAPPRLPRPDGLIAIPIPAGPSTLAIRYAHTLDQTLGDAITLLALPIFLLTLRPRPKLTAHSP